MPYVKICTFVKSGVKRQKHIERRHLDILRKGVLVTACGNKGRLYEVICTNNTLSSQSTFIYFHESLFKTVYITMVHVIWVSLAQPLSPHLYE